jgi:hypothetical protein
MSKRKPTNRELLEAILRRLEALEARGAQPLTAPFVPNTIPYPPYGTPVLPVLPWRDAYR